MKRNLSTMQKVVASAAVLATAGALTAGAFAAWQSTASQHQDVSSATVSSTMTATGGGGWTDVDVMNVLPGNMITRYATLTNTGSIEQTFTLTTHGATNNLTDTEAGMQVKIQACSLAWVAGACTAQDAVLTTPRALAYITDSGVVSSNVVLPTLGVTYLRVDFSLPSDAVQADFQGKTDKFQVVELGVPTDNGNQSIPN
jgi:hypothetical protein